MFYSVVSAHLNASAPSPASAEEAQAELRDVLNRMLIERIKALETASIATAGQDPKALARYRELQTRRLQLEQAVALAVQSAH
jgi:DNA primase